MLKREVYEANTTGNVISPAVEVDSEESAVAFQFEVTVIGATPTVTYKWQGSLDGTNWDDVAYITAASDTVAATTRARTTVSVDTLFLANPLARIYRYYRLVTTLNTNVTFKARIFVPD